MAIYLISDPHFGHKNIIKYENRPFESAEEMDEVMIENWNKTVSKKDTVICLGDFSFHSQETTAVILKMLNGRKELILGNHDRARSVSWWQKTGFDQVYKYPICIEEFYWLSHEPMYMNKNMPYCNLHGHIHSQKMADETQFVNLSVEHINYTPVLFEGVKKDILKNA